MPVFLNFDDPMFDQHFDEILSSERNDSSDVNSVVSDILEDVKRRKDEAVIELTHRFDKIKLKKEELSFSKNEIDELSSTTTSDERKALDLAANRIRVFH
jgi:histidinol dehydrogenase